MGLISSNSYLVVFSAGTLIGAASTYLVIKLRNGWVRPKDDPVWSNGMEERYDDDDDEVRLILGIRRDLNMQKGKVAAQCGHASMAAYAKTFDSHSKLLKQWLKNGGTKIALRVNSEQELLDLDERAKEIGVLSSIIRDAGQTQVEPGARTVIAIGPARKSVLDKMTGHLKLY